MTQQQLSILISAQDQASQVLRSVEGALQSAQAQAQNLASKGFRMVQSSALQAFEVIKRGTVVLAGFGTVLGGMAIKSASDMETMSIALETSFQGNTQQAQEAQKAITEFATRTPYQLQEVMTGFIKLKNMGLDPSQRAMTAYGNTASAMGKGLNDMVEAVADAATGEFERLKEFGIRASKQGDKVKFTFKGVEQTVKMNSKDIENYLIKLGETNFAGGMEKQSQTLSGLMSTLKDSIGLSLGGIAKEFKILDIAKNAILTLQKQLNKFDPAVFKDKLANNTQIQNFIKNIINAKVWLENFFNFIKSGTPEAQAILVGLAGVVGTLVVGAFVQMGVAVVLATLPFVALGLAIGGLFYLFQTNTAIRDFLTNTWSFLVNQFNNFKDNILPLIIAKIQEFANYFNQNIAPKIVDFLNQTWTKLVDAFNYFKDNILPQIIEGWEKLIKGLKDFSQWYENNKPAIENFIVLLSGIATGFTLVYGAIAIYNVVLGIATFVTTQFGIALAIATSPVFLLAFALGILIGIGFLVWKNWDFLNKKATEIFLAINNFIQDRVRDIKNAFQGMSDFIGNVFNGIGDKIKQGLRPAFNILRTVRDQLNGKEIMGFKINIPEIPAFANGGIVGGSSYTGDKILARVNSGEVILNQKQQKNALQQMESGKNINISLNFSGSFLGSAKDRRELIENMGDELIQYLNKRGATV